MLRRVLMRTYRQTPETVRKIVVGLVGGTIALIGVALLVLPGPALVVIPLGLGILALEFGWARRWLRTVRERSGEALDQVRAGSDE